MKTVVINTHDKIHGKDGAVFYQCPSCEWQIVKDTDKVCPMCAAKITWSDCEKSNCRAEWCVDCGICSKFYEPDFARGN